MNSNLYKLNEAITEMMKLHYYLGHVFRDSEPDITVKTFKIRYKTDELYGKLGELWDGKSNAYITRNEIKSMCSKFAVSKNEYDAFYNLPPEKRIDALAHMYGDAIGIKKGAKQ